MLFVLPVSHADAHLIQPLVQVFKSFGGLENHKALVVTAPATADDGEMYAAHVRPLFEAVSVLILPNDPPPRWPQGCNQYFKHTAIHVEQRYREPWYWFEADCTPLKAGWVNELVTEYALAKMPFMGTLTDSWMTLQGRNICDGTHMVGTGIYPPNLSKYSKLWRYADGEPWDIFSRWEIIKHVHHTIKIQQNWGTGNYRRQGKGRSLISCDQVRSRVPGPANSVIRKESVVLHGCKDNSIRDVILEGLGLALVTKGAENE